MVAWIVNSRLRPRGTPRYHPRFQCHFGSHLSLISKQSAPFFSYTYVEPILQPLCFQIYASNGGTPLRNFSLCSSVYSDLVRAHGACSYSIMAPTLAFLFTGHGSLSSLLS